jgi:hypothetical protein
MKHADNLNRYLQLVTERMPYNPARECLGFQALGMDFQPVSILDGVGPQVAVKLEECILCVLRHDGLIWNCVGKAPAQLHNS